MSIEVRKCSGGMISTEIIIMTKTISVNTVIGPNESVLYKTRCQTISNLKKKQFEATYISGSTSLRFLINKINIVQTK